LILDVVEGNLMGSYQKPIDYTWLHSHYQASYRQSEGIVV